MPHLIKFDCLCDDFFVCSPISFHIIISALFAFVSLFSAHFPAFYRSERFAVLTFRHHYLPFSPLIIPYYLSLFSLFLPALSAIDPHSPCSYCKISLLNVRCFLRSNTVLPAFSLLPCNRFFSALACVLSRSFYSCISGHVTKP